MNHKPNPSGSYHLLLAYRAIAPGEADRPSPYGQAGTKRDVYFSSSRFSEAATRFNSINLLYSLPILQILTRTSLEYYGILEEFYSLWSMHPFKPSTSIHLFLNQQFNGGLLRLWRSCPRNRETANLSPKKTGRLGWAACFLMACANKATWPQSALTTPLGWDARSISKCLTVVEATSFFLKPEQKVPSVSMGPLGPLEGIGLSYATLFLLHILWLWQSKSLIKSPILVMQNQ